jgi:hypothetical protein
MSYAPARRSAMRRRSLTITDTESSAVVDYGWLGHLPSLSRWLSRVKRPALTSYLRSAQTSLSTFDSPWASSS